MTGTEEADVEEEKGIEDWIWVKGWSVGEGGRDPKERVREL